MARMPASYGGAGKACLWAGFWHSMAHVHANAHAGKESATGDCMQVLACMCKIARAPRERK
eukprot:730-Chlamydomonas_euryale.AAC.8